MSTNNFIKLSLIIFNAIMLSIFLATAIFFKILTVVTVILITLCVISFGILYRKYQIAATIFNFQLSLFYLIILFMTMELFYAMVPGQFPAAIKAYLAEDDIQQVRRNVVEYLDENPFVKFRPECRVRSQGFRGTKSQFAYEWTTDRNGFKNLIDLSDKAEVDNIAVGDSFTEGMGVDTDKTWAALLTINGSPTYNLAVQGYAPTQFEGVYGLYGKKYKHRHVIIGYVSATYIREHNFLDRNQTTTKRELEGGIASIASAEGREIRYNTHSVTMAIYMLLRNEFHNWKIKKRVEAYGQPTIDKKNALIRYLPEINRVVDDDALKRGIENNSIEWQSTLRAFSNIKQQAGMAGADVTLLYFPGRGDMYYEKLTGLQLPARCLQRTEVKALKIFCEKNNLRFIDLSGPISEYVNNLPDETTPDQYPYLEIDGHLSNQGHRMVAKALLKWLNNTSEQGEERYSNK